jgi:hypothetical protein
MDRIELPSNSYPRLREAMKAIPRFSGLIVFGAGIGAEPAAATPQTLVGNTNGFIRRLPRRTERRFPLTTLSASRLPCA